MEWLNYNHLYYFWMIAREGSVTSAARQLRLSQSTLSAQFKQLEDNLGQPLFDRAGIRPDICAEADDMALIRLLALSGAGLALVPEIVVQFELEERKLMRVECVAGLAQKFYAITATRRFANPLVARVIHRFQDWLRKKFNTKAARKK